MKVYAVFNFKCLKYGASFTKLEAERLPGPRNNQLPIAASHIQYINTNIPL